MCNVVSNPNTISATTIVTILSSIILTVIGWFLVSLLTSYRENKNRRKNIRIEYLVNAYRDISIFITRESNKCLTMEVHNNFERAIRDIQIYGSVKEIELVKEYISNISKKGYSVDPLLNLLRDNLRETLKLEKVNGNTYWAIILDLFNYKAS